MDQISFAEAEYNHKKKKTRRERFFEQMDKLIPWKRLENRIRRHYSKPENGRQPYPLEVMLRIHCMQSFYNLSDPGMEDALNEVESMRRFAGLSLSGPIPDENTILNFRHLLEKHLLGEKMFDQINAMLREGTIVDATIFAALSSTKNEKGERDSEMHQAMKGNEWHFGVKLHVGVDDTVGMIHEFAMSPANAHDFTQTKNLLHGEGKRVWGDANYQGVHKRSEFSDSEIQWHIAMRLGKRRQLAEDLLENRIERVNASVRAKVEHSFLIIKKTFGYSKVRYRGLVKNSNPLYVLAAFANLLLARNYMKL